MPTAKVLIDRLTAASQELDRTAATLDDRQQAGRLRAAAYGAKSAADYLTRVVGPHTDLGTGTDPDFGSGSTWVRFDLIATIAENGGHTGPVRDLAKETLYAWMCDEERVLERVTADGDVDFYLARHDYR